MNKLYCNELIDKYNYGQLSEEELVLFNSTLETNNDFRTEFNIYLKMREYILDDNLEKFRELLVQLGIEKLIGTSQKQNFSSKRN